MSNPVMSSMAREHLVGINAVEFAASLSPEDREIFMRADLGIEIEAWLSGNPVGRFLANMVEIERADAVEALVASMSKKPADTADHQQHHRRIERCDQFKSWLMDAIEVGRQAQGELQARDHTD